MKRVGLEGFGLEVVEIIPVEIRAKQTQPEISENKTRQDGTPSEKFQLRQIIKGSRVLLNLFPVK